jgi:hypothetical protein
MGNDAMAHSHVRVVGTTPAEINFVQGYARTIILISVNNRRRGDSSDGGHTVLVREALGLHLFDHSLGCVIPEELTT